MAWRQSSCPHVDDCPAIGEQTVRAATQDHLQLAWSPGSPWPPRFDEGQLPDLSQTVRSYGPECFEAGQRHSISLCDEPMERHIKIGQSRVARHRRHKRGSICLLSTGRSNGFSSLIVDLVVSSRTPLRIMRPAADEGEKPETSDRFDVM
jgi:hypothetical protein